MMNIPCSTLLMLTRSFSAMLPARTRPAASRNGRGLPGLHLQSRPTRVSVEPTKVSLQPMQPVSPSARGYVRLASLRRRFLHLLHPEVIDHRPSAANTATTWSLRTVRSTGQDRRSRLDQATVQCRPACLSGERATTSDASGNRQRSSGQRASRHTKASIPRRSFEPPGKTRFRNVHLSSRPAARFPGGACRLRRLLLARRARAAVRWRRARSAPADRRPAGRIDGTGPGSFTCSYDRDGNRALQHRGADQRRRRRACNPAIRAVVRTAVHHGIDVYAVADGYRGLIQGGDAIRRMESADVGGILQRGGIGRPGRRSSSSGRVAGGQRATCWSSASTRWS